MDELEQIREQNRWNPEQQEQVDEEPKSTLPAGTISLMIGTGVFFDTLQLIFTPTAIGGSIITIFATLLFFVWFKMHGVSFITPKRLLTMAGAGSLELIPFLNILPAWTGAVWYIIYTTKVREVVSKIPGGKAVTSLPKKP